MLKFEKEFKLNKTEWTKLQWAIQQCIEYTKEHKEGPYYGHDLLVTIPQLEEFLIKIKEHRQQFKK